MQPGQSQYFMLHKRGSGGETRHLLLRAPAPGRWGQPRLAGWAPRWRAQARWRPARARRRWAQVRWQPADAHKQLMLCSIPVQHMSSLLHRRRHDQPDLHLNQNIHNKVSRLSHAPAWKHEYNISGEARARNISYRSPSDLRCEGRRGRGRQRRRQRRRRQRCLDGDRAHQGLVGQRLESNYHAGSLSSHLRARRSGWHAMQRTSAPAHAGAPPT